MEKILICLPTYHSPPEWIHRAINSIKSQTYSNFDCWIVKDGCGKALNPCLECDNCINTIDLCKNIKDPRFSFHIMPVHCSGAGWGPRNYAILNTNHNLISYLDDDNWWEPNHLEELHKNIYNKDLAYTGTRLYNTKMEVIQERLHNDVPKAGYIDTSEILHRRHLINKYGAWRYVKKCCDWDLVKRWTDVKWGHTGKITLNFFVREGCGIHRI